MSSALLILGILAVSGCIVMCAVVLGIQLRQIPISEKQLTYLDSIERYCVVLSQEVQEQLSEPPGQWHSVDGKYKANTIDELMRQMLSGKPRSAEEVMRFLKDINSEIAWSPEDSFDMDDEQDDGEDGSFM